MSSSSAQSNTDRPDVVLIGAGIMSATLGIVLRELEPSLDIAMFEALHDCAQESSDGWNNAGTGHAANCELNYTPQRKDGSVDISKAVIPTYGIDLKADADACRKTRAETAPVLKIENV